MLGTLGWQELLIILVILALLFGASRVAGLGGALGRGIREFRTEARGDGEEDEAAARTDAGATTAEESRKTDS
ncbi:MAG: twin-arginine translocase TatA/TatE family subunit [Dehalococcoidia bacterium]|nr:twin-arginine translocase TatA/TatE family subunit [Dehalococcoidia bacterium]